MRRNCCSSGPLALGRYLLYLDVVLLTSRAMTMGVRLESDVFVH